MSENSESLRRKIKSAGDLDSVVRTMKALAASNIGQYERAVLSLADYFHTIELGLCACFRQVEPPIAMVVPKPKSTVVGAIVLGSDQGLVGQFNDVVVEYALGEFAKWDGKPKVWVVGERARGRLADAKLEIERVFTVPNSVGGITALVEQIQTEVERPDFASVYIFHNRPHAGSSFEPASQRLLPLDAEWRRGFEGKPWPTRNLPEVIAGVGALASLIHEYLFISLYRACAESLSSENASRLAAMERAEKNIGELKENLSRTFHRLRQNGIDEELFDVISGFEALTKT